ncbi:hypothetical protein KA005_54230, partial [bacterium]|nr:hypothetical protein [bacterium]
FGPKAISRWDWGQSYIQLKYKGFAFSYGTENMWWGPALINPILMSNTAAGFPHFSLGTARPIKALAGHWELQMISGSLVESEWFDEDPDNNTRIFTGVIVDWQPRFIPGLVIGGARVFYQYPPEGNNRLNNFLMIFEPFFKEDLISASSPHGEDIKDQLVSVFIRWVFPESGLETYFELARNDHSWNLRDFMLEPEHSRAYTFGMQKVLPTTKIDLILSAEFTQLGPTTVMLVRSTGAYYYHGVRQGYTHKGQLLGAGIGSGAESENIGLSGMTSWGKWDFSFTRIRWENDAFFSWIIKDRPHAYWDHDVSFIATLSGMIFRNNFCFKGAFSYMREYNRYFIRNSDVTNLGFTFSIQRF